MPMKSEMLTTSSEESDHQEVQEGSSGTKRSYDCTFCKRGFTNARALGGHMNIHRKERTKANTSKFSNFTNEESMASSFVPGVSNQPSRYCCILESPRNYDNMFFQPSEANPRNNPASYTFQYDFLNSKSQSLIRNQEQLRTNLSLQLGSSIDQVGRENEKDGEGVDLELRLGHDPYSNY